MRGSSLVVIVSALLFAACGTGGSRDPGPPTSSGRGTGATDPASKSPTGERPAAVAPSIPKRPPKWVDTAPFGPAEPRADWVVFWSLKSDQQVWKIADEVRRRRANIVFLQVRSRGDANFPSSLEPTIPETARGFDAIDATLDAAEGDYEVHLWINCCLVASAEDPPTAASHVFNTHPEWLTVPKAEAAELRKYQTSNPTYRSTIARHAAAKKSVVEGVFIDPALPAARAHVAAIVADLCARYPIAGIHLDYVRYPDADWGFGKPTLDLFRAEVDADLSTAERKDMAARVAKDPFAYTTRYASRFANFRRQAVTKLVQGAADAARRARPGVIVSAAVFSDQAEAKDRKFQEWMSWLNRGTIDVACPMAYTQRNANFETQVRAAVGGKKRGEIWIGIGSWLLNAKEIARRVQLSRSLGADGIALFSHQGTTDIPGAVEALLAGPFKMRAKAR